MIHLEFLLLVAGGAGLRSGYARRLAGLSAVAAGLGIAALEAGPMPGRNDAAAPAALPLGFVAVEGALLLAAAVLALAAARAAVRDGVRDGWSGPDIRAGLALAVAGIWVGVVGGRCAALSDARALIPAVAAVVAIGGLLLLAGRRWPSQPASRAAGLAPPAGLVALGAGALLAAAGPRVGLVFAGVVVAAIAGYVVEAPAAGRRLPIAPLLTLLLVPAWWLMATIASPGGLPVGALADLPWSPAAELGLALVLLVPAWAVSGLWPLQRQEPATFTAPVGALLLARVAIPVAPDGIAHWRPLAMPLILAGLWHAAIRGRRPAGAAALAWIGLLALEPAGAIGAALLLVGALTMELSERMARAGKGLRMLARVAGAVVAGFGALLALEAGLHAEVVYTVLAAAVLAIAAVRIGSGEDAFDSRSSLGHPDARSHH